jgi:hypothetical protein
MRWARAAAAGDVGHRPGQRLVWHEDWRRSGGQRRVGDDDGGPAALSRAMLPQARVGAGRTQRTTAMPEGGKLKDSSRVKGDGSTWRAVARHRRVENRRSDHCWGRGERNRASGMNFLNSLCPTVHSSVSHMFVG